MNENNSDILMLIGSLSNDLFRVASLSQRGSKQAAERFLLEAKRWAEPLVDKKIAPYIVGIAQDISKRNTHDIELESAERYLMYGVLLQNYSLHYKV